jgi:hypothetical protein
MCTMIKNAHQVLHQVLTQRKTAAVRPLLRNLVDRARGAGQKAWQGARGAGQGTVNVMRQNPVATGVGATAATVGPLAYYLGRGAGQGQGLDAAMPVSQAELREAAAAQNGQAPDEPGMVGQALNWAGENWQPLAIGGGLGLGGLALANYLMDDEDEYR